LSSPQLQTPAVIEAAEQQPFYIPATDSPTRPRRTLKHGDTFSVLDSHGDIGISAGGADGIFDKDTRHLSLSMLKIRCDLGIHLPATIAGDDCISATSEFAMAAMHHGWR
jgi:hypothetical protein